MQSARLAAIALAGLLWTSLSAHALAPTAPSLGSAASFAVLGGSAVTDSGSSIVTGNVGVSPGHTITGFADGSVQIGAIYIDDALARQAQKDNTAAYNDLAGGACTPTTGMTLGPGVYCLGSPLTGVLTLDAAGDPNAVWIFRGTTLATTANAAVQVINNGCEGNVFWQVSGSATLGAGTALVGSILALSDITFGDGSSLSGRALSQTGTVRLNHNKVSLCCDPSNPVVLTPSTLPNGSVGTMYPTTTFIASGGTPPYTYAFSDGIPPGLTPSGNTLSGKPSQPGEYCFFVTATDSRGCHATREYCIIIDPVCAIVIDPPELPRTCSIDQKITASGGTAPYTFSATELGGVTLVPIDPNTAVLSGTPLMTGCHTITVTVKDAFCTASRTYTICNLGVLPETLPRGMVGTPYPATTITAPGATSSYMCSISGLPKDMSPMPPAVGCSIGGQPAAAGCSHVTVTVTDDNGFTCSRTYLLCVDPAPIHILPDTLPKACVGVQYSQTITATGGTPPYHFELSPTSPLGLTFTGGTLSGVLSGVPNATDCVPITVVVTDAGGVVTMKTYTLCGEKVIVTPDVLPDAEAGVFYSQTITASGGEDLTLAVSGLPRCGLNFNATNATSGVISGTPVAGCSAFFTITASDKNCSGKRDYQIDVTCPPIAISPPALPGGNVSSPYSQAITATGGSPPYTFTVVSGALPPGLTLASSGALSGTPTTVGTYCFDVAATDSAGCADDVRSYTVVISAATCPGGTVIVLSPPTLPFATTFAPYAQLITASGGTPPYTFAVTSGALPPGLILNTATGLVSGTPTASGTYTLTIGATDANGCFGSMGCSVMMTVDIPATSEWGMVVLASLLAMVGVFAMKGRI